MKEYYYKIDRESAVYQQMKKLLADKKAAEEAAATLARSLGATGYIPSDDVDYGGIELLEFPDQKVDKKVFRFAGAQQEEDGREHNYYAVNVTVKEQPVTEVEVDKYKDRENVIITEGIYPFDYVSRYYTQHQAADLVGLELKNKTINTLLLEKYILYPEFIKLSMGHSPTSVIEARKVRSLGEKEMGIDVPNPKIGATNLIYGTVKAMCNTDLITLITESMEEERQLKEALGKLSFKLLIEMKGTKRAMKIYRDILNLPCGKSGTINRILGINGSQYSAGVIYSEEDFSFKADTKTSQNGCIPITAEMWETELTKLQKNG